MDNRMADVFQWRKIIAKKYQCFWNQIFFSKGQRDICSSFKDVSLLRALDAFENCLFCAVNDPAQALPLQTVTEGTQNLGRRECMKNRGAQP